MLYFRDADGRLLEPSARHTLADETTGAFGGAALSHISEIGYPVADVATSVARLQRAVDTPTYGEPHRAFTAVGD